MPNLSWYEMFLGFSFIAAAVGLSLLLIKGKQPDANEANDMEETEETLLKMTFVYWMVYCIANSLQKIILPDWEDVLITLRLTALLAYFLTFSCVLSLPLHHLELRRQAE